MFYHIPLHLFSSPRWLQVCSTLSFFTYCSVCLYLPWLPLPEIQKMSPFPIELQVRLGRNQSLGQLTDRVEQCKNVKMFYSAPSRYSKETRNWATSSQLYHSREGVKQSKKVKVKVPYNFSPFECGFFLIGYSLGCCRSLTSFQSLYKVILVCYFFYYFSVGEWRYEASSFVILLALLL